VVAVGSATALAEVVLPWTYPKRLETERIVMFFDDRVTDPQADLAAMDAQVARMVDETGLPLCGPIYWVRGALLGKQAMALPGFALGSSQSPAGALDRHELAHVVLAQHFQPGSIPPMLLNEGWADSQANPRPQLAEAAAGLHDFVLKTCVTARPDQIEPMLSSTPDPAGYGDLCARVRREGSDSFRFLEVLTDPWWYGRDKQPVYSIGGAFADFIIRRYGTHQFVELFLTTRPGTFASTCQSAFGLDLPTLERDFWRDVEEQLVVPSPDSAAHQTPSSGP
jgi:hypothetical protein